MTSLPPIVRTIISVIAAALVTAIIGYAFIEARIAWYMWNLGIYNRAELSEDYGGAFSHVLYTSIVCLIVFPVALYKFWRLIRHGLKQNQISEG